MSLLQIFSVGGLLITIYRTWALSFYLATCYDDAKSKIVKRNNQLGIRSRSVSDFSTRISFCNNTKLLLKHEKGIVLFYLLGYFLCSGAVYIDVNGYSGNMPISVIDVAEGLRISFVIAIFLVVLEYWISVLKIHQTVKHKRIEKLFTVFLLRVTPSLLFTISVIGCLLEIFLVSADKKGAINGWIRSLRYIFYAAVLSSLFFAFTTIIYVTIKLLGGYKSLIEAFATPHTEVAAEPALDLRADKKSINLNNSHISRNQRRKATSAIHRLQLIRTLVLGAGTVAACVIPISVYFGIAAYNYWQSQYFIYYGTKDEVNDMLHRSFVHLLIIVTYLFFVPGWKSSALMPPKPPAQLYYTRPPMVTAKFVPTPGGAQQRKARLSLIEVKEALPLNNIASVRPTVAIGAYEVQRFSCGC